MNYLAYRRSTRPTGRALARALGFEHWGVRRPDFRPQVLVRWGTTREMPAADLVLNDNFAIEQAADKVRSFAAFAERGVPHVPYFESWPGTASGIVFGRSRFGMSGQGITIYRPGDDPPSPEKHAFFTLYQQPTRELRLHVVGGEVIRIQGKYHDFPVEADPLIRNHKSGFRFRTPRDEVHSSRRETAVAAVEALGLDFGAVDMLIFGSPGDELVLEVNSAPACSPLTLSAYAEAIQRLISL